MGGDLPWQRQRYGCCGAGALDKNMAQNLMSKLFGTLIVLILFAYEFEKMPSSELEL